MELRDITDKIYASNDREKMFEANELFYEAAEVLRTRDERKYEELVKRAEDIHYSFTLEEAKALVKRMRPYGEKWTYDEVKDYVESKGVIGKCKKYYLCMNMMYNDYRTTAEKYDVSTDEFYFDMATDFINDEDGVKHKVEKYFMMK